MCPLMGDLPARARELVFGVVAAALLAGTVLIGTTLSALPVTGWHWLRFATLAGCVVVHTELTRDVERRRQAERRRNDRSPYQDFKSVWNVAGVLLLPPVLALAVVVVSFGYVWLRVPQRNVPMALGRWVYTGSTVVLGSCGAVLVVLLLAPDPYAPGLPPPFWVLVLAAAVRWAGNYLLVVLVIAWSRPNGRSPFADFREQIYSVGALCAGISAAVLVAVEPALGLVVLGVTLTVHRSTLITEYRFKATTDERTGLTNDRWWTEQAAAAIARARATGTHVGVLIADLDRFKTINDSHGHLVGNEVLAAVARIISREVRDDHDVVGRWGGEEFAVLLPNISPAGLVAVAERIRKRVVDTPTPVGATTVVVTVSIGAAHFPRDGATLSDLVSSADRAMYAAKAGGRNRIHVAG